MIDIYETFSAEETFELGKKLAKSAEASNIFTLEGDLGVGKTVFTQGFAAGLDIEEPVDSPTFTIIKEYDDGRLPLYHFDVYRIGDVSEMDELGYEDYFFGNGVTLVEWANLIEEIIPKDAYKVEITKDLTKGVDYRKITVKHL